MPGRVEVETDGVYFHSRFGFSPGMWYTVTIRESEDEAPIALTIDFPPHVESIVTSRVVELYPTSSSVPFNQLRLYVEFSAAMSEGQAAQCVHVIDEMTGVKLDDVLLQMNPELWDRDRRRLTLLFDPGRIKQGLLPHMESGYPLVQGRPVKIVIDADFMDATGQPLRQAFERHYEVGADVRQHVDPSMWKIHPPRLGTMTPLIIDFDRALDYGLLQHSIHVLAVDGAAVAGRVAIGHAEQSWAFVPAEPWLAGDYRLEIDHRLEDLAGNSVSRIFDRELGRQDHDRRSEINALVSFFVVRANDADSLQ